MYNPKDRLIYCHQDYANKISLATTRVIKNSSQYSYASILYISTVHKESKRKFMRQSNKKLD